MWLDPGKKTHLLILGVGVAMVAATAWRYRSAQWLQQLTQVDGPTQVNIKFDNGSVRDKPLGDNTEATANPTPQRSQENALGKVKKCLRGKEVIYTDQPCALDAKAAPIQGGSFTVMESAAAKTQGTSSRQPGPKALRDALDISGDDKLRDKMMERVINRQNLPPADPAPNLRGPSD